MPPKKTDGERIALWKEKIGAMEKRMDVRFDVLQGLMEQMLRTLAGEDNRDKGKGLAQEEAAGSASVIVTPSCEGDPMSSSLPHLFPGTFLAETPAVPDQTPLMRKVEMPIVDEGMRRKETPKHDVEKPTYEKVEIVAGQVFDKMLGGVKCKTRKKRKTLGKTKRKKKKKRIRLKNRERNCRKSKKYGNHSGNTRETKVESERNGTVQEDDVQLLEYAKLHKTATKKLGKWTKRKQKHHERRQQHCNQHLFKLKQEEYIQDGLDGIRVDFEDNQDCLGKEQLGLLSLLYEETPIPNGRNLTQANELKSSLHSISCFNGDHKKFCIEVHYKEEGAYETTDCLEKNRGLFVKMIVGEKRKTNKRKKRKRWKFLKLNRKKKTKERFSGGYDYVGETLKSMLSMVSFNDRSCEGSASNDVIMTMIKLLVSTRKKTQIDVHVLKGNGGVVTALQSVTRSEVCDHVGDGEEVGFLISNSTKRQDKIWDPGSKNLIIQSLKTNMIDNCNSRTQNKISLLHEENQLFKEIKKRDGTYSNFLELRKGDEMLCNNETEKSR